VINLVVDILHLILFTIVFLIRIALFGILPLGELISEKCVYAFRSTNSPRCNTSFPYQQGSFFKKLLLREFA